MGIPGITKIIIKVCRGRVSAAFFHSSCAYHLALFRTSLFLLENNNVSAAPVVVTTTESEGTAGVDHSKLTGTWGTISDVVRYGFTLWVVGWIVACFIICLFAG